MAFSTSCLLTVSLGGALAGLCGTSSAETVTYDHAQSRVEEGEVGGMKRTSLMTQTSSEIHLLQLGSATQARDVLLEVDNEDEPAVQAEEASTCSALCLHKGVSYSCRARSQWVLNNGIASSVAGAVALVNEECEGQCSCSVIDFSEHQGDLPDEVCRTATEGEKCYKAVEWARTHGIRIHPDRYDGLNASSSFEEFQDWLHRHQLEGCRRPCDVLPNPHGSTTAGSSAPTSATTTPASDTTSVMEDMNMDDSSANSTTMQPNGTMNATGFISTTPQPNDTLATSPMTTPQQEASMPEAVSTMAAVSQSVVTVSSA